MIHLKRIALLLSPIVLITIFIWYWFSAPTLETYNGNNYSPTSSPEFLKQHVIELSENISSRKEKSEELDQAADYIFQQLKKYSEKVYFQYYDVHGHQHKNVIAELGPNNSDQPLIIIGAHYDTYSDLPGADDNASGVAGIIELARLLQTQNLKKPLQIIAYTLEEPPHFRHQSMGSYQHAKLLSDQGKSVSLMLSIEMIGYYSDQPNTQAYPVPLLDLLYPDTGNFITLVTQPAKSWQAHQQIYDIKRIMARSTPLPVYSIMAPAMIPGIDYSDHRNYWRFGYPGIMVTDTAFYRNKNYHTPHDTWEKLDYQRMAMVVDGIFNVLITQER